MSAYTHQGVVYFVVVGRYVKVGYTASRVENRMRSMLTGRKLICPDDLDRTAPLQLVGAIPGCVMRDEQRIHGLFAAHRVAGEWFRYDAAFIEQMLSMRYVTYKDTLVNFRHARAELKRRPSLASAA